MSLYMGRIPIGQISVSFKGSVGENTYDATLISGSQMLKDVTAYSKGIKYTGTIPTKTVNDIVVDKNIVTIPYGYYSEEYIKTITEAVVATPTISVSNTGLITASTNQTTGYVNGTTKNATQQLTTKGGTTITPTTSEQTVVSAGTYVTGDIKVAAVVDNSLDTSDATATADDIFNEKTAYVNGEKITGNFTITEEITDQEDVITQIQNALEGKAIGGGANIDTCTMRFVSNGTVRHVGRYYYTSYNNGVIQPEYADNNNSIDTFDITLNNVICGSVVYFDWAAANMLDMTEMLISGSDTLSTLSYDSDVVNSPIFQAPSEAGAVGVVTFKSGNGQGV